MHIGFCRAGKRGETNLHHQYASAFRTYKRKYYDQTSGFDVTLPGAEDIDMIYKMEEIAPIHFVDQVLYYYRFIPGHRHDDTKLGIISHAKAKSYAYFRRLHTKILNLTFLELLRQLVNLGLSLI
jgi:hypothetical protein